MARSGESLGIRLVFSSTRGGATPTNAWLLLACGPQVLSRHSLLTLDSLRARKQLSLFPGERLPSFWLEASCTLTSRRIFVAYVYSGGGVVRGDVAYCRQSVGAQAETTYHGTQT